MAVAAPAAAPAAISLTALLLWLGLLCVLLAYRATLGAILLGFAAVIDDVGVSVRGVGVHPFGRFAELLVDVDHKIRQLLGEGARGLEDAAAYFFDKTWSLVKEATRFNEAFAHTMEGVIGNIYRHAIPEAERRAAADARRRLGTVAGSVAQVTTVALPGIRADVGALGGKVGRFDDVIRGLRERIRGHERLLVGAGVAALGIRILGRLKLGWLRCTKVGKMGRATCAMDLDFLNSVLAASTIMFGSYSLVQFAEEMQDATDELAGLVRAFWRAT